MGKTFIPNFRGSDGGMIEGAYTLPQLRDAMDFQISMVTAETDTSIKIQVKGRGKLVVEQYNGSAYSTAEYWMSGILTIYTLTLSKGKNIKLYGCVTYFSCGGKKLTTLDVTKNPALESLYCQSNQLNALDVSKNTALKEFNCSGNQLTSLDVSHNPSLTNLQLSANNLTELDVSKNTKLNSIDCIENPLWSHIGDVIAQLPQDPEYGMFVFNCDGVGGEDDPDAIYCLTDAQVAALEAKGWHAENNY